MPIVILLLIGAAIFGRARPQEYYVNNTWMWIHGVAVFGGTLAFAIAGVVGMMYLINLRRIRAKAAPTAPAIGDSLERLETFMTSAVTLGFALLTIGVITGIVALSHGKHVPLPKLLLASSVWVVYAIVLHAPINPSFRGRKAAVLSVVGFALMVVTIVAVMLAPTGGPH
jgi:ABC-type uncharacterized transport system permease subunit